MRAENRAEWPGEEREMKEMRAYALRYRTGGSVRSGVVKASSMERAQKIGRQWCNEKAVTLYLEVYDPMVAEEREDGTVAGVVDQGALGFK